MSLEFNKRADALRESSETKEDYLPKIYSTNLVLSVENLRTVHDNNIFRFTIEDMYELSPFSCLCFGVIEKNSNNNPGQRFFENVMVTLNTNDYVYFNNGTVLHHIDFITVDKSLHSPEYRCYKNLSKKFWWNSKKNWWNKACIR